MKPLTNEQYNAAKFILLNVVPALVTLIAGLGVLYGFDATKITATIGLFATFAGSVLMISTKRYNEAQANEDDVK